MKNAVNLAINWTNIHRLDSSEAGIKIMPFNEMHPINGSKYIRPSLYFLGCFNNYFFCKSENLPYGLIGKWVSFDFIERILIKNKLKMVLF